MIENINLHYIFFVDTSMKKNLNKITLAALCFTLSSTFLFRFRVSDVPSRNSALLRLDYKLTFFIRMS